MHASMHALKSNLCVMHLCSSLNSRLYASFIVSGQMHRHARAHTLAFYALYRGTGRQAWLVLLHFNKVRHPRWHAHISTHFPALIFGTHRHRYAYQHPSRPAVQESPLQPSQPLALGLKELIGMVFFMKIGCNCYNQAFIAPISFCTWTARACSIDFFLSFESGDNDVCMHLHIVVRWVKQV